MTEPTNSKVPRIRFKGFAKEWEEKKIESICSISTGKSNTQDRVSDGIYPFYVRSAVIERSNRYLYDEEAILTVGDGVGTGKVFHYVNGKYDLHQRVYRMHSFAEDVDAMFFFHFFSNHFYKRVMAMTAKTSVDSVRLEMISQMDFRHPSKAEQTQIGGFFREVERLIGLHQRKHNKLVTLKKAMLHAMFPQPGTTTPEIRFKGFEGEWVEKKLGDIINLGSGRDYKHLSNGNIPVYGTGGYMLSVNDALSSTSDAIGIGRKGTIDKPYILKAPFWTVDTLFYAIPRDENDLDFVFCIFQGIDWMQKNEATGVPSLSKVAINGVDILSTSPTEQQKIGTYFRTLDELISRHAVQLAKLKQLKAACLEKMFV